MRRSDIACVLCLSCVLIVLHVKSMTSCPVGWFGSLCNYRCRCVNNKCDKNGQCIDPYTCQGGWFGPECQYFDIAFGFTTSVLTDGNDSSCANSLASDTVTLDLYRWVNFTFTWIRVFSKHQGSAALKDLSLKLYVDTVEVSCTDLKKVAVDNKTLDMNCNSTPRFNKLTLKGAAVPRLCSVHISGGRNLALKGAVKQNSTHSYVVNNVRINYTADLAVDDDVQDILSNQTCSQTSGTPTWTLVFSQTRLVHWYRINNRKDSLSALLKGFTLESFDSKNNLQYVYKDPLSEHQDYYYYRQPPLPVKMVIITASNSQNILSLCEVRVFGDSLCDSEHYGRDCELRCQCLNKAPCLVTTGMCPNGCPDGYRGQVCMTECSPGKFGKGCNQTCSSVCVEPANSTATSCNHVTGDCLHCKIGFTGPLCEKECFGTFGQDCNQTCSSTCEQPVNSSTPLCNPITGACFMGCQPGYSGALCETVCAAGYFGKACKSECSKNCKASDNTTSFVCDPVTGACLEGCKDGSSGELCENVCGAGTFGKDCKSECSKNCKASDNTTSSVCDPVTGVCLNGCKGGWNGKFCENVASDTSSNSSIIPLIIGLCSFFATAFFVGYCLRKKKRTRSSEEATAHRAT